MTKEEIASLWQEGVFAFDASSLLDIYKHSSSSRESIFSLLRALRSRIWLPNQAALEFYDNQPTVVEFRRSWLKAIENEVSSAKSKIDNKLQQNQKKMALGPDKADLQVSLARSVDDAFSSLTQSLKNALMEEQRLADPDSILQELEELFEGRVGPPYETELLTAVHAEAARRYTLQIPPGYMDSSKEGARQYGDFVIWSQLVDHAAKIRASMVFVTNDEKEDWWSKRGGKHVGPRPLLIREMRERAGARFHTYTLASFLSAGQVQGLVTVPESTIQETQEVEEAASESRELGGLPSRPQDLIELRESTVEELRTQQGKLERLLEEKMLKARGLGSVAARFLGTGAGGQEFLQAQQELEDAKLEHVRIEIDSLRGRVRALDRLMERELQ